MIKKFNHKKKDFYIKLHVDGAGDPITNRKGFAQIIGEKYMGSSILNPYIIDRDFRVAS